MAPSTAISPFWEPKIKLLSFSSLSLSLRHHCDLSRGGLACVGSSAWLKDTLVGLLPALLPYCFQDVVFTSRQGGVGVGCYNMREGLRGDFNEKSSSELERCSVKVHMAIMRRATSLPAGGESLSVSCSCSYFGIFSCLSLFSSVPQWSVKSHGGLRPSTSPPPVSISTERGGKKASLRAFW